LYDYFYIQAFNLLFLIHKKTGSLLTIFLIKDMSLGFFMLSIRSQFCFFTAKPDIIALLKQEIQHRFKDLRLAFSSKTLLTYKHPAQGYSLLDLATSGVIFCEHLGLSFSDAVSKDCVQWAIAANQNLFLLAAKRPHDLPFNLDVIKNLQKEFKEPNPQPSRAYYKIKEATQRFGIAFKPGALALEIGSAPGGTSLFLLEQDLFVMGVDAAQMDLRVAKHPRFTHLTHVMNKLDKEQLKGVCYLLIDVNISSFEVASFLRHYLSHPHNLKSIFWTVKWTRDLNFKNLNTLQKHLKKLGASHICMRHLTHQKNEFLCIIDFTSKPMRLDVRPA